MKTEILPPPQGITEAVKWLSSGEVVALPTETVYGLGGCALDAKACARIFEAKDRPLYDPLIVHLPTLGWLERLAEVPPLAAKLAAAFWPGPLTMVLPRTSLVPDLVTAGQDTVAVRMSAHPIFQQVAVALDQPIAAPSANRFGRISPTRSAHVWEELQGRIPLIVEGGACEHGIESTIVLINRDGPPQILRHGPITKEHLERFGPVVEEKASAVATPGGLKSHYAPRTPLDLVAELPVPDEKTGLLSWQSDGAGFGHVEYLSRSGDLREAAADLYGAMRRLDESGVTRIVAEKLPAIGLGAAIMERLSKAAFRD